MISKLLIPKRIDNKKRFGRNADGGYILCAKYMDAQELVSLGCSNESSFEKDVIDYVPGMTCRIFDLGGKCSLAEEDSRVNFTNLRVKNLSDVIDKSVKSIVQIDIEGSEWETILNFEGSFDNVLQMAIEFHPGMYGATQEIVEKTLMKINKHFYLIHIHANNHKGIGTFNPVPDVIECSYINKNLVTLNEIENTCYPKAGLDYPNTASRDEIDLCWWMN
jgi:hypothetical protein